MLSHALPYLESFWQRRMRGDGQTDAASWPKDVTLIAGLGLGLQETHRFLYEHRPSLAEFEDWILTTNGGSIDAALLARLDAALNGTPLPEPPLAPVLSADELAHWDAQGFVVLREAVPPEDCAAAAEAIYEFLDARPDDPQSWYHKVNGHSIWVPLLRHPVFARNRHAARIRSAFAQLWGRQDLWVNTDQCGFNPPVRPDWPFPGPHLHWDVSLAQPFTFGTQAILYLTDTGATQGAFQCVPGFHHRLAAWLAVLPPGADPRAQDLTKLGPVPVAGRAGDLIIWHHLLPHGSSPNHATLPRLVQYLNLQPADWQHHAEWI